MNLFQRNLEGVKCAIQTYLPKEKLEGCVVETQWMHEMDVMAVRLTRTVWSDRLADESVRWPATWWDAFKVRWFPRWALRRWPPQHNHADFAIYRGYPDVLMPERKSTLFVMRQA